MRALIPLGGLLVAAGLLWLSVAMFRRSEERRRCPVHINGGDVRDYPEHALRAAGGELRLCRKHRAEQLRIETMEKELGL